MVGGIRRSRPGPLLVATALLAAIVSWAVFAVAPAAAQSPPAGVAYVSVERADGKLTASWNAAARATNYHITYSADGGRSWSLAALKHTGTSITISGVDNSKSYVVGVRARNAHGDSGWRNSSAIGPYHPPKPKPAPKPPARPGVVTLSRADGTLTAFWSSVGGATSYHVTYSADNGASWSLAALNHPAGSGTTSITISGVDNGKPYIVGVRARNAAGDSAWRNSSAIGRYEPPPAPPAVPTGLAAAGSDQSVTLTWNRAVKETAVTGYQFQIRAAPPAPGWSGWLPVPGSDGTTTSYTISKLKNGTEYRFKLRAVNAGAVSAPAPNASPWYVAATPNAKFQPPQPPTAPPAPTSLNVTRGDGTLTVTWHHAQGATGYQVNYSADDGQSWKMAAWWNATTSIIIPGMDDYATYKVAVRARNDVGDSPWTNSDSLAPLYTYISNLHVVTNPPGSEINATTQQAVAFTTGANFTGYTLARITASLRNRDGATGNLVVTLHRMNGSGQYDYATSIPSSIVQATLSGANPSGSTYANYTYTCSGAGCNLDANATYFVVAAYSGSGNYDWRYHASGDLETRYPTNNGWNIGRSHYKDSGESWSSLGDWHTVRVVFTPNPLTN